MLRGENNLFFITINYKNYSDTIDFIYTLLLQENTSFKCLIIDNNSENESVSEIIKYLKSPTHRKVEEKYTKYLNFEKKLTKQRYQLIEQIEHKVNVLNISESKFYVYSSKENLGFSGGNNFGIEILKMLNIDKNYVISFLNNDTLLSSNYVDIILNFFSKKEQSAVTTQILFKKNNKILYWYNGGYYDPYRASGYHNSIGKPFKENFESDSDMKIDFMTGCVINIPSNLIFENNIKFDNQFFLYGEDLDFSLQLKKSNIKMHLIQNPAVFHKVGSSSPGNDNSGLMHYYSNRNRLLILRKWGKLHHKVVFAVYFLTSRSILALRNLSMVYFAGIIDGLTHTYGEKAN